MNSEAQRLAISICTLIKDEKLRKLVYNTMDAIYSVGRYEGLTLAKKESSKE